MVTTHDRLQTHAHRGAVRRQAQGADADHPTHGVLRLQRNVGNAAVARMLAQRDGPDEETQRSVDTATISRLVVQRAAPDEEDAQRSVMQRAAPDEEDAQRAPADHHASPAPEVGLAGGPISDGLTDRINSRRGGGAALDDGSRTNMEQAFGGSFSDVRIHTDSESDALNRSISAKAFTTGSDIFFSKDASPSDSRLLAHEMTHVVQQRGSSSAGGGMTVSPAGDAHESAADAAAASIASGGSAPTAQREDMESEVAARQVERAPQEEEAQST